MNFTQFLRTVRTYWLTFVAVTLAVLALGIAWLVLSPLQYVSTAQLLVAVNGSTTANAYQNDSVVASRVNTYVALVNSDVVSQRVVDKLKSKLTAKELGSTVTVVQVPLTAIIDIAAAAPSADEARNIANAFAEEFVGYVAAIESPTGEDGQKVQVTIVSSASQPQSRLLEKIALGGLIALLAALAGATAVWVRSATDPVIRARLHATGVTSTQSEGEASVGPSNLSGKLDGPPGSANEVDEG